MATTAVPYSSLLTLLAGSGLNYLTGTAVAVLCDDTYTPSQTGHSDLGDITGELTDLSYARVELTGKAQGYSSGVLSLSADDSTFPALVAPSIRYVVFAMLGLTDAASPLIGYWNLGANQSANVNDFKVIYPASGFLTLSVPV